MKIRKIWSMSTFRLLLLVVAVVVPLKYPDACLKRNGGE